MTGGWRPTSVKSGLRGVKVKMVCIIKISTQKLTHITFTGGTKVMRVNHLGMFQRTLPGNQDSVIKILK